MPSRPRNASPESAFRTDLYQGTAPYYDRYRPPYPGELFDDLCRRLPVSGAGRLLDLACGTGQIALPLAGRFGEVVAVDQEPESVAFGQAKADVAGVTNINWLAGRAETVQLAGPFELVAVGNAFQRLDRPVVAERCRSRLQPRGGIALLWAEMPWQGDRPWQRGMAELFDDWTVEVDVTDRVPAGWQAAMDRDPHHGVLARAGLDYVGKFDFSADQIWTAETLTGFVYSTSLLNLRALGDKAAAFERDLAAMLRSHSNEGVFHQTAGYAYELARRRPRHSR